VAGVETSRLGFGCAFLTGGIERSANLRRVRMALEAGFRHFDTAPAYGLGASEEVLAEALGSERGRVTVATKVGLPRPTGDRGWAAVKALVRPVIDLAPGLRAALTAQMAPATAGHGGAGERDYSAAFLTASLDESLRRLGGRIDALLLHEIAPGEITEEIERCLEDAKVAGKIGAFGIATTTPATQAIVEERPAIAPIAQRPWAVFDEPLIDDSRRLWITYRAIQRAHGRLSALARADRAWAAGLSQAVGRDVSDREALGELLLAAALANNPAGIVLISSRRPRRIARFGAVQDDPNLIAAGARLTAALGTERERAAGLTPRRRGRVSGPPASPGRLPG